MPIKALTLPTEIDLVQFVSVQAHDLRSPFNQIIGFSKMLINTVGDGPITELQISDLNTVYRSGMSSLTLVNALIDIARLNRGEKTVTPADAKIETIINNSIAQWKKAHPGTETRTEIHIHTSSATLRADELVLQQVVAGFIAYVELFCESKTTVSVTVEDDPAWNVFALSSTGVKARMPSEMDVEMLGYINRAFVELHGGSIRRAEENDEGALVQFALPKG
jgi:K+-sensing histidine kinase KdpD